MTAALLISFPFFAIIFTGYCAGRFGLFGAADVQTLNKYVFTISMPVALFGLMSLTRIEQFPGFTYVLVYLCAALITILGAYGIARRFFGLARPDAGVHAFATTLGNAVFLGLPVAQSIEGWGPAYVVLMLAEGVVIITIGSILIAGRVDEAKTGLRSDLRTLLARPARNPLIVATLCGFVFSLLPLTVPPVISKLITLIGATAGPVALFSLGLFLSSISLDKRTLISPRILHIALFKLGLLPLLTFAGLHLAGITASTFVGPLMLFTLLPSGVVVYLSASTRGRYVTEATTAIGLTTLASLFTISAILYVYA
ncbi:MAG: AEC family transporter [Pseudomonadota bacterium]